MNLFAMQNVLNTKIQQQQQKQSMEKALNISIFESSI